MNEDVLKDIGLIEQLVGRISSSHHPMIEQALQENRGGVMSLASRLSTSGARSPVAVFISNIRAGEHKRGEEIQAYRARRFQHAPPPTPEQLARNREVMLQWKLIRKHLNHPIINEMWQELKMQCRGYVPPQAVHELMDDGTHHVRGVRPSYADPTNDQAKMVRETLIYVIKNQQRLELESAR